MQNVGQITTFQGLVVQIMKHDATGNFPVTQIRYDATGRTEWIASDCLPQ